MGFTPRLCVGKVFQAGGIQVTTRRRENKHHPTLSQYMANPSAYEDVFGDIPREHINVLSQLVALTNNMSEVSVWTGAIRLFLLELSC
jgi:hypothetical protein